MSHKYMYGKPHETKYILKNQFVQYVNTQKYICKVEPYDLDIQLSNRVLNYPLNLLGQFMRRHDDDSKRMIAQLGRTTAIVPLKNVLDDRQ